MEDLDRVDPADAALQELLAYAAVQAADSADKEFVTDFLLTMAPLVQWSPHDRQTLIETCRYVTDLGQQLRQRNPPNGLGTDPKTA